LFSGSAVPGPQVVDLDLLSGRLLLIRPHLDERAWRLLLGAEEGQPDPNQRTLQADAIGYLIDQTTPNLLRPARVRSTQVPAPKVHALQLA
jgi:hypothetical protein